MPVLLVPLPWEKPPLSLNDRLHHHERARVVRSIREATGWAVKKHHPPSGCAHISVALIVQPPDRRRRDADNYVATLKACCDSLVDIGIVTDDTPIYMTKHMPIIGPPGKPGKTWLRIDTEAQQPEWKKQWQTSTDYPSSGTTRTR